MMSSSEKGSEYHKQIIVIAGFIGAIAFAALTLLVGQYQTLVTMNATNKGVSWFVPLLVGDFAAISATFICCCVYALPVASGLVATGTHRDRFAKSLFRLGWAETALAIVGVADIASVWAALGVGFFEIVIWSTGYAASRKDPKTKTTSLSPSAAEHSSG